MDDHSLGTDRRCVTYTLRHEFVIIHYMMAMPGEILGSSYMLDLQSRVSLLNDHVLEIDIERDVAGHRHPDLRVSGPPVRVDASSDHVLAVGDNRPVASRSVCRNDRPHKWLACLHVFRRD